MSGVNYNMQKIILGYEKFDPNTLEGWNYNGRTFDQSLNKTYTDEQNEFYNFIYRTYIRPQDFPDSYKESSPLFNRKSSDYHDSLCVQEIKSGTTYFYPIIIRNLHLYVDLVKEIEISDKVTVDVKNGHAYIIFVYHQEGDLHNIKDKFYNLVSKMNLPKKQILFFHSNHSIEKFQDAPFQYVPVDIFSWWLSKYSVISDIIDFNDEKLFLLYSRQVRFHRLCLFASLIQNDLLDLGVYSCGKFRFNNDVKEILNAHNYSLTPEQADKLRSIELTSPDNQISNSDINNCPNDIFFPDYQRTFVSLVAETLSDSIFLSEKTYKPIAVGHPFILLGGPGHLAYLKSKGYKTFDQYWNEDYDQEPNLHLRIKKIVEILTQLNTLTSYKRIQMKHSMLPILQHNQQLFKKSFGETVSYIQDQTPIRDFILNFLSTNHA